MLTYLVLNTLARINAEISFLPKVKQTPGRSAEDGIRDSGRRGDVIVFIIVSLVCSYFCFFPKKLCEFEKPAYIASLKISAPALCHTLLPDNKNIQTLGGSLSAATSLPNCLKLCTCPKWGSTTLNQTLGFYFQVLPQHGETNNLVFNNESLSWKTFISGGDCRNNGSN